VNEPIPEINSVQATILLECKKYISDSISLLFRSYVISNISASRNYAMISVQSTALEDKEGTLLETSNHEFKINFALESRLKDILGKSEWEEGQLTYTLLEVVCKPASCKILDVLVKRVKGEEKKSVKRRKY